MELILEKMVPPPGSPRISRRRLLNLLDESLYCYDATVIHGRAGTGKTLLSADFARRCGRRVAWYKVDAPEVDLGSFLRYLVSSVAGQSPAFNSRVLAEGGQPHALGDLAKHVDAFAHDLQNQKEPLLLIIDDLHLVYDTDWVVPFFRRLLPLLTAEVHLLLMARSLPPAPLWRLRSKQRLYVIDESALAFTLQETQELALSFGLGAESVRAALVKTRGRAAALDALLRRAALAEAAA